jgi:hypothetical protein
LAASVIRLVLSWTRTSSGMNRSSHPANCWTDYYGDNPFFSEKRTLDSDLSLVEKWASV